MNRLDRYELKFLITPEVRDRLMPDLMAHLRPDENAGEGAHYPVVSLYYDTPQRDCYWEYLSGTGSRRKVRVRVYGSSDGKLPPTVFAEVKHKSDGRIVKRRVRLTLEEALEVAAGRPVAKPLGVVESRVVAEIHTLVNDRNFLPCCCMRYDRHAYAALDPTSDLRITFDTGIAYRFDRLVPAPDDREFDHYLTQPDSAVMEIKVTGVVPYWLTRLIGETGCVMRSHSKYCRALEEGDPVLREWLKGRPSPLSLAA